MLGLEPRTPRERIIGLLSLIAGLTILAAVALVVAAQIYRVLTIN